MKKCVLICIILPAFLVSCVSVKKTNHRAHSGSNAETLDTSNTYDLQGSPKLVVGIVVDQMRYDYLTRFYSRYGDGGFKRLMNDGFNAKNNHYNFIPTYTAPGHASIYTGTSPMNHGIIGNNWYDKFVKKSIYNASDNEVDPVGTESMDGKMSPKRLLSTTVTDELELHTQGRAKVIGISIKDRGAILPAGHAADAAYWFKGDDEGHFVSSSFYMNQLPNWVQDFNSSQTVKSYLKPWNTLYPTETYIASSSDLNSYERAPRGKENAVFPYDLEALSEENGGFSILKATPYGNGIVTDFALKALKNESLGVDDTTDFLTISYSSTDYVGHQYGANSVEVEDTYLRLDLELEKLLSELDNQIGIGNYTVFLTADHGAVHNPTYLMDKKINAGYFDSRTFEKNLDSLLVDKYDSDELIEDVSNSQIFLNKSELARLSLSSNEVQNYLASEIIDMMHIDKVFTREALMRTSFNNGVGALVQNGFHQKRSGDLIYHLQPAVISYSTKGSTHGSAQTYDTHVPLLFYGYGIMKGSTFKRTEIIDIAPTISSLLGIPFPNAATGNPIIEVLKK